MNEVSTHKLRMDAIERAEQLLARHKAQVVAREDLIERAISTAMQPSQKDWQKRVEEALHCIPKCGNDVTASPSAMLQEWEDLIVRLEGHALQLRKKDKEIAMREQNILHREKALKVEQQRLVQENQRLAQEQEAFYNVRTAVEERTRELNLREAELTRRFHAAAEADKWQKETQHTVTALQEREMQLAKERCRCEQLLDALSELYTRLVVLI